MQSIKYWKYWFLFQKSIDWSRGVKLRYENDYNSFIFNLILMIIFIFQELETFYFKALAQRKINISYKSKCEKNRQYNSNGQYVHSMIKWSYLYISEKSSKAAYLELNIYRHVIRLFVTSIKKALSTVLFYFIFWQNNKIIPLLVLM